VEKPDLNLQLQKRIQVLIFNVMKMWLEEGQRVGLEKGAKYNKIMSHVRRLTLIN